MNVVVKASGFRRKQIMNSIVFKDWEMSVGGSAWKGTITVLDVDFWGGAIHALVVKLQRDDQPWAERTILRSPTVDVQVRLTDKHQTYFVMVSQYRNAVGQVVISNPAGGTDWGISSAETARKEVIQETGLPAALVNEGRLRLLLPRPFIVTPAVTNERTDFYLLVVEVDTPTLRDLVRKLHLSTTGVAAEGEATTVHCVLQQDLLRYLMSYPDDAKTALSLHLGKVI